MSHCRVAENFSKPAGERRGLHTPVDGARRTTRVGCSLDSLAHAKGMRFGSSLGGRGSPTPKYGEAHHRSNAESSFPKRIKMPLSSALPPIPLRARGNAGRVRGEHAMATLAIACLWHHPRWLPRWLDTYDFGSDPAKSAETLLVNSHRKPARSSGNASLPGTWSMKPSTNITGEMRETALSKDIRFRLP